MIEYVVPPEDTLVAIANRFNVSLQGIENANPEIQTHTGTFDLIFPGQIVKVP